jgi:hypothetical protein
LEKQVQQLDSDIASLIQKPMTNDMEDRLMTYGQLFCLLQWEPQHLGQLLELVNLKEMDGLLHFILFILFGRQNDQREEYLLLSLCQVMRVYLIR